MVRVGDLRRRILKRKGIADFEKQTKRPLILAELPDPFPKTPLMKAMELKYSTRIESIIFKFSLNNIVQLLGGSVDRSTVSKWRKYIHSVVDN